MHDVQSGLAAQAVNEVAGIQDPVLVAVEHDVVGDAKSEAGVGVQLGGPCALERVGLDRAADERARHCPARRHVGECGVRVPLRRRLMIDDVDLSRVAHDRGEAGRIDGDVDRRIDVERAHVFEERILAEGVSGQLRLDDLGGSGERCRTETSAKQTPRAIRCLFIVYFLCRGGTASGSRQPSASSFSCGEKS